MARKEVSWDKEGLDFKMNGANSKRPEVRNSPFQKASIRQIHSIHTILTSLQNTNKSEQNLGVIEHQNLSN
jgi:hypothetical protein